MNPQSNEVSGMQLPAPVTEQFPAPNMPVEGYQAPIEQAPAGPEMSAAMQPASSMPLPSIPMPDPQYQVPVQAQTDASATTQSSGLSIADDSDLIEKEWVTKAKMIVERNRDDPYKQTEELTVVKADYMQKRYNKTIKMNK